MKLLNAFLNDERGAVTVDWVVLTAGVVGMAMTFMTPIKNAVSNSALFIADQIGLYSAFLE